MLQVSDETSETTIQNPSLQVLMSTLLSVQPPYVASTYGIEYS